jgi:hypothetical protein
VVAFRKSNVFVSGNLTRSAGGDVDFVGLQPANEVGLFRRALMQTL